MKHSDLFRLLFLFTLFGCIMPLNAQEAKSELSGLPETCYLFSYFTGNGQDGLHLAWSTDGYTWQSVPGSPFIKPVLEDKIMRDPCVQRGKDGTFHLVWTTSWTKGGFGYASSPDLIHWSKQRYVPAMQHEPKVQNTWAPELSWDEVNGRWMIYWASTITGRFAATDPAVPEGKSILNHRIYATFTRDFKDFSPTVLFYDDGFSVIDATIVPVDDRFALLVKDERHHPEAKKNLRLAWSDRIDGPYGAAAPSFSRLLTREWLEGPTVIKVGDTWFLYADEYRKKHYVLFTSKDFASWTDETPKLSHPEGMRHGTAFPVPREVIERLLKSAK
jgi:hypothetical protein